ncbi:hypothetical protein SARC_04176 [Sphaeroforma arctica JP610]|uniref:Uncharacterized protein n=1 Tax=Sphaeroforma arctica JP610 TaxID=667725 RepID=A0A0L0G441_9EUKA|nr:hypothetical protein SARC_04176 [Sphaeroforma arctica JP610]KNC83571.1 hypothetical protein SARC_04176 [Sphaeroforma arctica JP610]|eukprot:XP_014157473.1 hypothetical protein SARC_04176 [Sphaeroforma arctica JP610]
MYDVTTAQADAHGWGPVAVGGNQWAIMYQHTSGIETATPEWPGQTWQQRVMLQLPLLMAPRKNVSNNASDKKKGVRRPEKKSKGTNSSATPNNDASEAIWYVTVQTYHRSKKVKAPPTHHTAPKGKSKGKKNTKPKAASPYTHTHTHSLFSYYRNKSAAAAAAAVGVRAEAGGDDADHYCVLDVVKTDSEGGTDLVRELVRGTWKGLHHVSDCAWDTGVPFGSALEDWVSVSLAGLVLPALVQGQHSAARPSLLSIGMGCSIIQCFIGSHVDNVDMTMLESSEHLVRDMTTCFPVGKLLSSVNTTTTCGDPIKFVSAGADGSQRYNAIMVHMNGPETLLGTRLKSVTFLRGLIKCLDTSSEAVLAVHVGGTEDIGDTELSAAVIDSIVNSLESEVAQLHPTTTHRVDLYAEEKLRDAITDTESGQPAPQEVDVAQSGSGYIITLRLGAQSTEYHKMEMHGALPDPRHYDLDSLVTIDMMLAAPGKDYEGGHLQTEEADRSIVRPGFERGDAVVFVSHKPHHVTPVTGGVRNVLVVEIWKGRDCQCAHRCGAFGTNVCSKDSTSRAYSNSKLAEKASRDVEGQKARYITNQTLPFRLGSAHESETSFLTSFLSGHKDVCVSHLLWEPYEERGLQRSNQSTDRTPEMDSSNSASTGLETTNTPVQIIKPPKLDIAAADDEAWDVFG